MTTTTVSPFVVSDAKEVELTDDKGAKRKYWKKEILPHGTRKYNGETLDFSKINPACIEAFNANATGAGVPFVLAMPDNSHPKIGDEIKQIEGDLHKLELGENGNLWGYFDLSQSQVALNAIKKSNGKFGVSGRIEVDYTAGDTGKTFPFALSHVCGTTRPHIKGLAGWQPVDLSEEEKARKVIDFSTEVIDPETTNDTTNKETGDDLVAVEIPKAKLDRLLAFMDEVDEAEKAAKDLTEGDKDKDKGNGKAIELSEEAQRQIAAAQEQAKKAFEFAERTQIDAAQREWAARKSQLANDGVPPHWLELAEPVMKRHKPVVLEFSENDKVDATKVISELLDAAKGTIKLSVEDGHGFGDTRTPQDKEYEDLVASFEHYWDR